MSESSHTFWIRFIPRISKTQELGSRIACSTTKKASNDVWQLACSHYSLPSSGPSTLAFHQPSVQRTAPTDRCQVSRGLHPARRADLVISNKLISVVYRWHSYSMGIAMGIAMHSSSMRDTLDAVDALDKQIVQVSVSTFCLSLCRSASRFAHTSSKVTAVLPVESSWQEVKMVMRQYSAASQKES